MDFGRIIKESNHGRLTCVPYSSKKKWKSESDSDQYGTLGGAISLDC